MSRKKDHINLAFQSQISDSQNDKRFDYEPLLSAYPNGLPELNFLDKKLKAPIWISSITGGTALARKINYNLAKVAGEFGLGMGLGSCRCLLDNDRCFDDFNVRALIGDDLPLYANLGISQVEQLIYSGKISIIEQMVDKLQADGLIIHVNPLQEFFQPEGDKLQYAPIETIEKFVQNSNIKIIVKEVGQGMAAESLKRLLSLPIKGIEFAAFGGTNFSKLEFLRSSDIMLDELSPLINIGHTAEEMLEFTNSWAESKDIIDLNDKNLIISGGISSFLDGYYLIKKSKLPAVYGQASAFLKYAMHDYTSLKQFVQSQIKGLEMAYAYLKIKEKNKNNI